MSSLQRPAVPVASGGLQGIVPVGISLFNPLHSCISPWLDFRLGGVARRIAGLLDCTPFVFVVVVVAGGWWWWC